MARSPDSSACESMLFAKIGWRFSDGRDFCQKNARREGSRVLHRSLLMSLKLPQAAGSFLKSSSYPEALPQTRPAQAAHPPSKLLGPEAAKDLRVSETICFWRKQEVLRSEQDLCLFLAWLFFGGKARSVSYQTLKLAIGWDFPKSFKVFGHLIPAAVSRDFQGLSWSMQIFTGKPMCLYHQKS